MPVTVNEMMAAADAVVEKIDGKKAQAMVADGALLLDVRDSAELERDGRAAGSHHLPRGLLEWLADPTFEGGQYLDPKLQLDRPIVLHCAEGPRAALAGKVLRDMGYTQVYSVGGLKDWQAAGGPLDTGGSATTTPWLESGG